MPSFASRAAALSLTALVLAAQTVEVNAVHMRFGKKTQGLTASFIHAPPSSGRVQRRQELPGLPPSDVSSPSCTEASSRGSLPLLVLRQSRLHPQGGARGHLHPPVRSPRRLQRDPYVGFCVLLSTSRMLTWATLLTAGQTTRGEEWCTASPILRLVLSHR
jgi:hypothetical protein